MPTNKQTNETQQAQNGFYLLFVIIITFTYAKIHRSKKEK